MPFSRVTWSFIVVALVGAQPLRVGAGEQLRMQVNPLVTRAPAVLTVRVMVPRAEANRLLQVVAESPTFYTSSEVQLEGARTTPLKVFEFRNLPVGLYEITGVLVDAHGARATVSRLAKVEPSVGSR
jgi:hypothetical protein